MPVGYLTHGNSLKGLRVAATEQRGGRVVPVKGAEEEIPSRLVVSSIGSIPEPIEGIPIRGEVYHVRDPRTGELEGMEGISPSATLSPGRATSRSPRSTAGSSRRTCWRTT